MNSHIPLKIAYPISWWEPDTRACREQTANTVAALANLGHKVTLIVPVPAGEHGLAWSTIANRYGLDAEVRIMNIESRFAGDSLIAGMRWLRQIRLQVRLQDFDLVYCRLPAILAMGPSLGIPFAFDHYRPWPDVYPIARKFIAWSGNSARCIGLVLHSAFAAEAYARAGIEKRRLIVAHNGGASAVASHGLSKADARQAVGLAPDDRIVLYAGRINQQKGLEDIFEMARLRPHVQFVMVGSEGHGEIEQHALSIPNVQIVPWQPSPVLAMYLAAADVLIIPPSSRPLREFGNCILPLKTFSYLAAGRPILAPDLPDTADLLVHEDTALIVKPDNPEQAVRGLDRLLDEPDLSQRLAANAAILAKECNWAGRATRISDFLRLRLTQICANATQPIVSEPAVKLESTTPLKPV